MIKSHFLIKLAGLGKKYPWIAYHHGYTATDLKMRAYNQLNRWSLPSATRVNTVCHEFANQLTRAGVRRDRIVVSHNSVVAPRPVSNDERQALRERVGICAGERVVLAVGRLSHEKGHADLVEAISLLRELDAGLKFKLIIVGEGPELQRLQSAIRERRLEPTVIFAGHVHDVAPYYAIADVLALPSHSEGSPNVLLEAMAAGLPTVATSVGGVPEIATSEKHALLVSPRDPQALARGLNQVLTAPDLAQTFSANSRAHVARYFSPESYAYSLIRIYQELCPAALA
jgi:glycosyltransferase involved in cell wall biosynthesis